MFKTIKEDIAAIKNRDPAARSALEFGIQGYPLLQKGALAS